MNRRVLTAGIGSEFGLSQRSGYEACWHSSNDSLPRNGVSYTANGRAALGLVAKRWLKGSGASERMVLLPAYLCHSMIQPFVELGLEPCFYPVKEDLAIDAVEIYKRIDNQTICVLVMHYFGWQQPNDLVQLINSKFPDINIIDDRTHLLLSDLSSGKFNIHGPAITIYSPRKWGPFPDLGVVVWPDGKGSQIRWPDGGYDYSFGFWRLIGVLLRTLFFTWPLNALKQFSLSPFQRADTILDRRVQIRQASPLSKLLWRFWDWQKAWQIRRENCQYLLDNWPVAEIKPLFECLPPGVCPLGFAVRTGERERLKQHLIANDVFPPIHWLRPSVVSAEEFPEAALLAEQELTIPIDQRYGLAHMDHILEVVCRN